MFDPYDDQFKRLAVWIRIPGLPLEFYSSQHLWRIGNLFGKTLKVDKNSLRKSDSGEGEYTDKGKYARICVEVDLRKSFVSKFQIGERIFPIAYEGLHLICFGCGRYGHRADVCTGGVSIPKDVPEVTARQDGVELKDGEEDASGKEKEKDEAFGAWMVVKRPTRGRKPKQTPAAPATASQGSPVTTSSGGKPNGVDFETSISPTKHVSRNDPQSPSVGKQPMEVTKEDGPTPQPKYKKKEAVGPKKNAAAVRQSPKERSNPLKGVVTPNANKSSPSSSRSGPGEAQKKVNPLLSPVMTPAKGNNKENTAPAMAEESKLNPEIEKGKMKRFFRL